MRAPTCTHTTPRTHTHSSLHPLCLPPHTQLSTSHGHSSPSFVLLFLLLLYYYIILVFVFPHLVSNKESLSSIILGCNHLFILVTFVSLVFGLLSFFKIELRYKIYIFGMSVKKGLITRGKSSRSRLLLHLLQLVGVLASAYSVRLVFINIVL